MKRKDVKEKKQLTAHETVKIFINEMRKYGTEEYNESTVLQFCQLTWVKATRFIDVSLDVIGKALQGGTCGIKERSVLSDNCIIFELTMQTGRYSIKAICEKVPYKPDKNGKWGVNPLSFYKLP